MELFRACRLTSLIADTYIDDVGRRKEQNKPGAWQMEKVLSHYQAGTGAILISSREEARVVREIVEILKENAPDAKIATIAAPGSAVTFLNDRSPPKVVGLADAYKWASEAPSRVLIVYDWHMICNNPLQWRQLIDWLP